MRTAVLFNFLLEANLMASAAILFMIAFRKFLRKPLGSRMICFLWLLIAVRLLCPLALSNPLINEIRPYYLNDEAIRPIAGQIKIRLTDIADELQRLTRGDQGSVIYRSATSFVNGMYYGTMSRLLTRVYLWGAGAVLLFFTVSNVRFRRRLKANRIEQISGKLREQYLAVCEERRAKPIPVWFVDPLRSACLVGVVHPYIALPLTAKPQEAIHVLTHEVCHYKAKDHWFGILRPVCCVLHWFNPLVWVAAFMSRTDSELACDTRVVQSLSPDDRMHYTNTLVLAASKRYAPGLGVLATGMTMTGRKLQSRVRSILNFEHTVKWLAVTAALLACVMLATSFFTAEGKIAAAPYLSQVSGFQAIKAGSDGWFSSKPAADGLSLQEALDVAMQAIHDEFGAETDNLSQYSVNVNYLGSNNQNLYMDSCWAFVIVDQNIHSGAYDIAVRASDGRIMDISGPGHG